jgi:tetratricopeptide (TPR) repeat protein
MAKGDLTSVIDSANSPIEERASALYNRGLLWQQNGAITEAIADWTAVTELAGGPTARKAQALYCRALARGLTGKIDHAIADCTAFIGLVDVPVSEKARALRMRAQYFAKKEELDKALADYTVVVEMSDAPATERAKALAGRAWTLYERGDLSAFVGDSRAALALDPGLRHARFNLGLGLVLTGELEASKVEYTKAASECTTANEIRREGIEDIQHALQQRGAIEGAKEILAMLQAREAALQEPAHTKKENGAE